MGLVLLPPKTQNSLDSFENLRSLESMCRECNPTSPLKCISMCRFYRLKNELRNLRVAMSNPNYMTELFNALKNTTRIRILQTIVNGSCSIEKIQHELKKTGCQQSQYTITEEYIHPLITVGLANEASGKYYATAFGARISEQLDCFVDFAGKMPPQSECHEEVLLQLLLSGPKTCEEIKQVISPTIASRILTRLATAGLVNPPTERNYIFFHRSKRNMTLEDLTSSAQKVYESIPDQGIPADKLAKLTGLSQRRIYKHLRHLKGKKLVFVRKIPRTYNLTNDGQKIAVVLQDLSLKVEETWNFSEHVLQNTAHGNKVVQPFPF